MYAYKQITVPAGQSYLTISLKAKLKGEGNFDCAILYLVPATVNITPDAPLDDAYRLFILYNSDNQVFRKEGYRVNDGNFTAVSHITLCRRWGLSPGDCVEIRLRPTESTACEHRRCIRGQLGHAQRSPVRWWGHRCVQFALYLYGCESYDLQQWK